MAVRLPAMFVVSEEVAAAIRSAYEQEGELSIGRRLFPGITDNAPGVSGQQMRAALLASIRRRHIPRRDITSSRLRPKMRRAMLRP
jgi:hypothetical protein